MKSSVMPNLIYRVVVPCGTLGCGYPKESLQSALKGHVGAIICDAGSMDPGPYYLGTGTSYFEREAVKADYAQMVAAGKRIGCPVIIGSSGMAGGNRNVDWMLDIAKEVFAELNVTNAKVAVIRSELDPSLVIKEYQAAALRPTGAGPKLDEKTLRDSTIVGQMGIHPLIASLDTGAQFIIAGRSCDVALFAADMIRRGIHPGLAYHVGHVLECGALACDLGSPSDCLVAEVYDDGSAVFASPNPARRCTPYSIAAHSLYQESHPQLQFYPEGILSTEKTQYFSRDGRAAGIRGSTFICHGKPWPWSIKLEGAYWLGARKASLIYIDPADLGRIPDDVFVYGRNGVRATPVEGPGRELGVIIETVAKRQQDAVLLAQLATQSLLHHGYPGRKTAAGNVAFPMSPNLVSFKRQDGQFGSIVPSGTRDPVFLASYPQIKSAVIKHIAEVFPGALANAELTITEADASNPAILLRTVDHDREMLELRHRQEINRILSVATPKSSSRIDLDAPDAYVWSLYHLLQNESVIRELFPITYFRADGDLWTEESTAHARYFEIGEKNYRGDVDNRTLSSIADHAPRAAPVGAHRILDMASVIRSKDAGINRLTFDIFFTSAENYEAALNSNQFTRENIAKVLGLPVGKVLGTFFVDSCDAIKISVERPNMSASIDERDVFGVQQQSVLEEMKVSFYPMALAGASSF
jgi:hypothetical protein